MKNLCLTITLILSCLCAVTIGAQTITNGIPWYDQDGKPVSAHGANIIRDGGKYYMFGEFKTDSANVFTGFSCYSSSNLSDWRFEGIAFSQQSPSLSSQPSKAGAQLWRMGPNRVGERPKVLKCPKTGEYIMLMHTDNMQYKDPCTCYATSKTITGPYEFQGPILYKGKPVTKWDIGSFVDDDGHAYLLVHHGMIYRLAEDFHSLDSCLMSGVKGAGESPAMMKKDGIYYWMSSHTTSWERNDNMYWTATSLGGPWTYRGEFCPVGSLTWNSQCSFLLNIDGQWMYMGDRWSFPRQHQAATYVWLPIEAKDSVLSIPEYMESWDVATGKPVSLPLKTMAEGRTLSNPGDSFTVNFIAQNPKLKAQNSKLKAQSSKLEGTRIGLKGKTDENSGYAEVTILNNKQQVVFETSVDFYSKTPATGLRWLSPVLPQGEYTLLVRCSEMKPNWTDKKRIIYGSKGHKVEVSEVVTVVSTENIFEYQNPISSGIDTLGIRDCHVFRDGDSWYMTGTAYPFWRRQEEGGKPLNAGVPLYRSDDLLHWQFIDYIVRRPSANKWYYRNFWAPEIRHIKGKYYCSFNCANADAGYKGIFCGYAVSDNLTGPYRVVTEDKPLSQGNDLTFYEEEDGTVWAFWNRGSDVGIIQSRIDLEKGKLLDEPKVVIPCGGKGEWDNIGIEGSCVFKRNGIYYLLYSSWTRGYEIGCATAPTITGPWTKCDENPIYGAQDPEVCKKRHIEAEVVEGSPFTQVGHNQVFIGPTGDYWLSCHGNIASNPEHPMLVIDPLKFREDGQVQRIIPSFTKQTVKIGFADPLNAP